METFVWAEKYRPSKLNDVIGQTHVVDRIKAFAKEKNIPHLLFAGPAGTGKTSVALALANELYKNNLKNNVLVLNASDERGIDVIRVKVKESARTTFNRALGDVDFRIILLDEADALTQEAQQALRRMMEVYTKDSRFILICNYSNKIIDPIQSRTAVFRFKTLSKNEIEKYIDRIAEGEKLKISDDAYDALITLGEGDLRKVTNLLQAAASLGEKITKDSVYDVASSAKPDDVKEMLETAMKGKFGDARKMLQGMMLQQGLAGSDIVKEIHRQLYTLDGISEEKKVMLIEKCGECDFRISEGANDFIQLEAFLAQFLLAGRD